MGIIPGTTICGLSDGAAWPVKNAISKFRGDFEEYINSKRSTMTSAQQLMEVH
jgi:NADH-quinone oxidoreductase subunit F